MDDFLSFMKSLWVVWMLLLFAGIVVWVLLPRNRKRFRDAARIPLDDDDTGPKVGSDGGIQPRVNS